MISIHNKTYNEYELLKGYERYEKIRKFHPANFVKAWKRAMVDDYFFDDVIDNWPELPPKKRS